MNTTIRWTLFALLAAIVAGLGGWYFFLQSKTDDQTALEAGRGLGTNVPSFFGAPGNTQANIQGGFGTETSNTSETPSRQKLWRVSETPVAGSIFITASTTIGLRFVERATGQVLQADMKSGEITRLTNTLLPSINEAHFSKDGGVILRSIDESGAITTFAGTIRAASSTSEQGALVGSYLEKNIITLAVHPTRREIFYTILDASGTLVGNTSAWNGTGVKRLFSSAIRGWQSEWVSDTRIVLTQNSADGIPGSAYTLSTSGAFTPAIRSLPGLTTTHAQNGSYVAGTSSGGTLSLSLGTNSGMKPVPLATVADKCGWSSGALAYCGVPTINPSKNFLNDWYKGLVHSSDTLWRINSSTGATEQIVSPESEFRVAIDVDSLVVSADGQYIAFIDKVTGSLWAYTISQ